MITVPWQATRTRIRRHGRSRSHERRNNVAACAVFRGTRTGDGGPVPPTGEAVEADYVYVMEFDGDRIRHMTKVRNDTMSLKQLGWE